MAFQATVILVMIASPSDVDEERKMVREIIHKWNYVNSLATRIVLIPVGWETHLSPELGARPQELINNRILKDCDLLIGVFWTRFGTPTGDAQSGTVEEIDRHVSAGKPVMLYFSSKPITPGIIDLGQYGVLLEFKEKCKKLGLIEEYDSLSIFREKFNQQLQICMNNNDYLKRTISVLSQNGTVIDSFSAQAIPAIDFQNDTLSEEALQIIKSASTTKNGLIFMRSGFRGRIIQIGDMRFGDESARERAKWEHALNELIEANLVVARGSKGEIFELTHQGWSLADKLMDSVE